MKSRFMPQVSFGSLVSLAILRVFYFTALLCPFFSTQSTAAGHACLASCTNRSPLDEKALE